MRRTFDDLWIIDLGGDNLGTRRDTECVQYSDARRYRHWCKGTKAVPKYPPRRYGFYAKIGAATGTTSSHNWKPSPNSAGSLGATALTIGTSRYYQSRKATSFSGPRLLTSFRISAADQSLADLGRLGRQRRSSGTDAEEDALRNRLTRAKLFKDNKYRKIERKYRDHLTGDMLPPSLVSKRPLPCRKSRHMLSGALIDITLSKIFDLMTEWGKFFGVFKVKSSCISQRLQLRHLAWDRA